AAIVVVGIAQLDGDGSIVPSTKTEVELFVVEVEVRHVAGIGPIVTRVVDDHVENDADRARLPIFLKIVGGLDEINQVLLGTEVRINVEIVVDVVTVIGAGVIFENGREPDGGATQAGNVIEVPGDAFDLSAVEVVWRGNPRRATRLPHRRPKRIIVEAIDHQKIDELFAPLPLEV